MDIICENSPSSDSISKSSETCRICSVNPNYQEENEREIPNEHMDPTCEISLTSESISKSYIPNILDKYTETPNPRKRRNSGRITPRYINRNTRVRNGTRRKKTNNKSKSIVHDENEITTKASKRRNSNQLNTRYNSRTSAGHKQTRRKRSNNKSKSFEFGDHIINIQNVKHDFHQLSPPEQRKFMKEMVTEITLRGVLPHEGGTIDKGLKIQNINKCVIQIEPTHGEYFSQGSDM